MSANVPADRNLALAKRANPGWVAGVAISLFVGCAATLLFARLGHYALWDDEAGTALAAKGVIRTFDTSAVVDGRNVFAYRNGALLSNMKIRYWAPLQAYLAAPFLAAFGEQSALAARMPFALCGLGTVLVLAWWLWRDKASNLFVLVCCAGLICNVSFFLYSRQCRYYGPALFFSAAIACLYLRWQGRRTRLIGLAVLSILLLGTNYLDYVALCLCLLVDYVMWERKRQGLTWQNWLLLLLPQFLAGLFILSIWNPVGMHPLGVDPGNWFGGRLQLFWWNWRELDRSEFGALPVLGAAPLLFLYSRDHWLLRAPLALLVFVLVVTLFSPQPVGLTSVAEIRYLAPVIPLCVAIEALVLCILARKLSWIAFPVAILVFGTNFFNGGPLFYCGFRSTIASYIGEVVNPPDDPYTVTAQWINEHLREGQSVWVLPNHATYPLMFHAPKVIYAWQLADPPAPQFSGLPLIHFVGRQPPDYLIAFGPSINAMLNTLETVNMPALAAVEYEPAAMIDHYWEDRYRPELFWRTFKPVTHYDRASQAIYVLKRKIPPISD
jgi:hypothetical protein